MTLPPAAGLPRQVETANPPRRPTSRNAAIDGLRGIAVAAVVYRHLGLPGLYGGGSGVFVFFTLSGFIITYLLCAEMDRQGRLSLGSFWVRRIRRLLPALLLTVALSCALAAGLGRSVGSTLREALPALGYFSNWWRIWLDSHPLSMGLGPFDHTWSLSIEEQFYLTWPLLFLLIRMSGRRRPWVMIGLTLVVAEAGAMIRLLNWDPAQPVRSANELYNRTDAEAELLLIGAAAGILAWYLIGRGMEAAPAGRWHRVIGATGLCIVAAVFVLQPDPSHPGMMHLFWTVGLTVLALGVAGVCLDVMIDPTSLTARVLALRPLPQLGRISYGIYLYHYPIGYFLLPRFAGHQVVGSIVVVVGTLVVSSLSWRYVEQPVINAGRRRAGDHRRRPPAR